ncbi:MAG: hypothetical protein QOG12_2265 [Verrucomicrobiota bacterium]
MFEAMPQSSSDTIPASGSRATANSLPAGIRYWAFVSYSHRDEAWAKWVHEGIETYRIPRALVGKPLHGGSTPRRLFPLFRDREELPGAAELKTQIQQALESSLYLIVICSPRAAVSRWVNREIEVFKSLGGEGRVLCLIVDGEPNADSNLGELECFPPAVRFKVAPNGDLTSEPTEPIAADARPGKDGKPNALLKLLSGMLNVGFDQLHQRERQRAVRRRIRWSIAAVVAALLLFAGYIALADVGIGIPGGPPLRTVLDRFDVSFFRRIPSDAVTRAAAAETRRAASNVLWEVWTTGTQFVADTPSRPGHEKSLAIWDQCQAISGLLRSPDLTSDQLQALVTELEATFAPDLLIEAGGKKYGFLTTNGAYTQAEPAIWNVTALAMALNRPGLLMGEERGRFERRLAEVQAHLELYWDPVSGGWNTYPDQLQPGYHATYTGALALLMLLELHEADLPWKGNVEARDGMLAKTAEWLISQWNAAGDVPGWRGTIDDEAPVSDGLTLQIYGELLRAEAQRGITIPAPILGAIPRHFERLSGRSLDSAPSVSRFRRVFVTHEGQKLDENPSVHFLWHPWGVEAVRRWLKRLDAHPVSPEHRTQMRRIFAYLVVNLGPEIKAKIQTKSFPAFMAGETMYAYSRIPVP